MRHHVWALGLSLGLAAVGCAQGSRIGFMRDNSAKDRHPLERPTVASLVDALKHNSSQLKSLECDEVRLEYRQGLQSYGADAKLACQKPRNFRLGVFAAASQQVDMGSNDQEFWYWIQKNDPPYVYRCSYQDFERGVELPFPFQPEWIMEGLGMGEYGAYERYELRETKNSWELVEKSRNSRGQTVAKVTEFSKQNRPQVRGFKLLDPKNREVYTVRIDDTYTIGGVVVPKRVSFAWPEQKLSINMWIGRSADHVVLNGHISQKQAEALFSRSTLTHITTIDIAEMSRRTNGGIQPAGGPIR